MTNNIIPALLEHDLNSLSEKLHVALSFSHWVHIDLLDASFTHQPNTHILFPDFFRPFTSQGKLELHMMVSNPSHYVKSYAEAGFSRLIGHIEHMQHPQEFISLVKHNHKEVFLGLDIDTDSRKLEEINVKRSGLDGVLIMTVKAGQSGQEFQQFSLEKVRYIHKHFPHLTVEVDGGINNDTLPITKTAGATNFAATSSIFNTPDPLSAFRALQLL